MLFEGMARHSKGMAHGSWHGEAAQHSAWEVQQAPCPGTLPQANVGELCCQAACRCIAAPAQPWRHACLSLPARCPAIPPGSACGCSGSAPRHAFASGAGAWPLQPPQSAQTGWRHGGGRLHGWGDPQGSGSCRRQRRPWLRCSPPPVGQALLLGCGVVLMPVHAMHDRPPMRGFGPQAGRQLVLDGSQPCLRVHSAHRMQSISDGSGKFGPPVPPESLMASSAAWASAATAA